METGLQREARSSRAAQRLEEAKAWVDFQEKQVLDELEAEKRELEYWEDIAAVKIQSVARGFLARLEAEELMLENVYEEEKVYRLMRDAAIMVQRRWRGIQGRIRAREERWRQLAIAPSLYAVKLVLFRSTLVKKAGNWGEYWDPETNSFWYFNAKESNHSTWEAPEAFRDQLTCVWDPWPHPYSAPWEKPCRRRFKTMAEYQQHRVNEHKWMCLACQHQEPSFNFPRCAVCGNRADEDGADLEARVRKDVTAALNRMRWAERAAAREKAGLPPLPNLSGPPSSRPSSSSSSGGGGGGGGGGLPFPPPAADGDGRATGQQPSRARTPPLALPRLPTAEARRVEKEVSFTDSVISSVEEFDPQESVREFSVRKGDPDRRTLILDGLGTGNEERPKGLFAGAQPPLELREKLLSEVSFASTDSHVSEDSLATGVDSRVNQQMIMAHPTINYLTLKVCDKFQSGHCQLTTCPMAHPGIRDAAEIEDMSLSHRRRRQVVTVCREYVLSGGGAGGCPRAKRCPKYHPYVRPTTEAIIRKLYPANTGRKIKVFSSGAELDGHRVGELFQGYGVCTWPDGSSYMGDWKDNLRHGYGIYRTMDGKEFLGTYERGVRQGPGVLYHPNGEIYYGDFKDGRITGVGRLQSANNDVYEGTFRNGVMEGVGVFKKGNGDKYMGNISKGRAHGLGIVAYADGRKYKGDFKDDFRHGRGVCAYPSGAKYAGHWELNHHTVRTDIRAFSDGTTWHPIIFIEAGHGVFVSADGERYVGMWKHGMKNGYGRYYFANGDIFDGDFVNNKARGQGLYLNKSAGTYYVGQWDNDKKNGLGTYTFKNGSRYQGTWKDNNIHGRGKFWYANGNKYFGEFTNNKKNGRGVYTWGNGNVYTGTFVMDRIEGEGEMEYKVTGHYYKGQWLDNKKHGQGIFKYSDGNVYEGEYYADQIHGKGFLRIHPDTLIEESYDGEWRYGVKHGFGIYKYKVLEGKVYEGHWQDGLRHGRGVMKFKDGSYYKGDFNKERWHGHGIFVWADGSQYDGKWVENNRNGEGTYLAVDGSIYQGKFQKNLKHGKGVITYLDGNSYEGVWDNDNIVGKGTFVLQATQNDADRVRLSVFGY